MTTNKSLKRTVRERMSKTGERYTAARRQVLAKEAPPEPRHGPTDRSLSDWFALLDAAGAREMPHRDIARSLSNEHAVPSWWAQNITVEFEKHIGRRVLGQRGATFSATGTKTIAVAADVARAAWLDEGMRARWLPDVQLKLRPNKVDVVKRFDVNESDGRLIVSFDPKGDARTLVAVEHEKLPNATAAKRWTTFWRSRLAELKELLEASATQTTG